LDSTGKFGKSGCEEKVIFGVILVHGPFTPARLMLRGGYAIQLRR
jgi:hypothetical protein